MDRAIIGFSGLGVNFMDSTTVRMGLKVFLARSDAVTDQLRRDFILAKESKTPGSYKLKNIEKHATLNKLFSLVGLIWNNLRTRDFNALKELLDSHNSKYTHETRSRFLYTKKLK